MFETLKNQGADIDALIEVQKNLYPSENEAYESKILYIEPNKNRTNSWLEGTGLQLPFDLKNYGPISKISYRSASVKGSIRDDKSATVRFSLEDMTPLMLLLWKKKMKNCGRRWMILKHSLS